MADWSTGSYELMAAEIEPVATQVIDAVEPSERLRLLDLCCGTGNATLVAAERGARAVGYDAASRLLEVARTRAGEAGLEIDWMEGDIHELPFPGESFDLITSVFGLIFSSDPPTAVTEIGRVLNHSGRFAISTWTSDGPLAELADIWSEAVESRLGNKGEPALFDWSDADGVTSLFAEHGLAARCEQASIDFNGESPDQLIDSWRENHPLWLAAKPVLGDDGFAETVERSREALHAANQDPDAFQVSSSYLIFSGSPV